MVGSDVIEGGQKGEVPKHWLLDTRVSLLLSQAQSDSAGGRHGKTIPGYRADYGRSQEPTHEHTQTYTFCVQGLE